VPFGVVRSGVDLEHAQRADDQAEDEKPAVEVPETAVSRHWKVPSVYHRGGGTFIASMHFEIA
jgi:hypothetical protein